MTLHPHRAAAPRDRWRAPGLPVSVPWCPSASFFQRDSGLAVPGFPLLGSGNRRLLAGTPHLWAHLAGYRGLGLASGRGGTHSVHDLLTDVDRAVLSRGHCGVTVSGVRRACVCVPSGAGGGHADLPCPSVSEGDLAPGDPFVPLDAEARLPRWHPELDSLLLPPAASLAGWHLHSRGKRAPPGWFSP